MSADQVIFSFTWDDGSGRRTFVFSSLDGQELDPAEVRKVVVEVISEEDSPVPWDNLRRAWDWDWESLQQQLLLYGLKVEETAPDFNLIWDDWATPMDIANQA